MKKYHTTKFEAAKDINVTVPFYQLELVRDYSIQYAKIRTMDDAVNILHTILDKSPVEQMVVLHMNSMLEIVGAERIAIGQLESVTAYMREVMRGAILAGVPRIIISHNHPSGHAIASEADIGYTLAAMSAGSLMGIEIVDHIVVAPGGHHYSIFQHKERLIEMMRKQKQAQQWEDLMNSLAPNHVQRFLDKLINGFTSLLSDGSDEPK